jgi:hypothetical protein
MRKTSLIAASFIIVLLFQVLPEAHHSFVAVFDPNKPIKLQGTVTKVEWMNPHIWFYLDVKDDKGSVAKWQCEGGNPNTLLRQGWTRDTLKPGMSVDVDGWQAKDGTSTCNARSVLADGKRLFAGSSAP